MGGVEPPKPPSRYATGVGENCEFATISCYISETVSYKLLLDSYYRTVRKVV